MLDVDTTIKPLCGKQQGAAVSSNPKKHNEAWAPQAQLPHHPAGGDALSAGTEVRAGDAHTGSHSLPGLVQLIDGLPPDRKPALMRGNCGFGADTLMPPLKSAGSATCSSSSATLNKSSRVPHPDFGRFAA